MTAVNNSFCLFVWSSIIRDKCCRIVAIDFAPTSLIDLIPLVDNITFRSSLYSFPYFLVSFSEVKNYNLRLKYCEVGRLWRDVCVFWLLTRRNRFWFSERRKRAINVFFLNLFLNLFKTFLCTPKLKQEYYFFTSIKKRFVYAFCDHKAISFLVRGMKSDFLEKTPFRSFPADIH